MNPDAPEFKMPDRTEGDTRPTEADPEEISATDDDVDSDAKPMYREVRGQLRSLEPNRWICPLDVHFSQMRARETFRCNRVLDDTAAEIRAVRCDTESDTDVVVREVAGANGGVVWRLETPFPPIEILLWRCKLRDEKTGRPKVDPKTGGDLCDPEERFFTLDNRRLYCLQKAAVSVYPDRAFVAVVELPPGPLSRSRELRKFRTLDRGRGVLIGGRGEDEELRKWSWRAAVGLPTSDPETTNEERPDVSVISRRRLASERAARNSANLGGRGGGTLSPHTGRGGGRGSGWRGRGGRFSTEDAAEKEESWLRGFTSTPAGGFVVFLTIYVLLRVASRVLHSIYGDTFAEWSTTTPAGRALASDVLKIVMLLLATGLACWFSVSRRS